MEILIESFFDYETFRDYFFHMVFKKRPAKILRVLLIIEVVVFLGILISTLLIKGVFDLQITLLGIIIIAVNSSYFLIIYLMSLSIYKKNQATYQTKTVYAFKEKQFQIGLPKSERKDWLNVPYKKIAFIEETRKYFFIFLDDNRAYVIPKKHCFTKEVKLRGILKKEIPNRYYSKQKIYR